MEQEREYGEPNKIESNGELVWTVDCDPVDDRHDGECTVKFGFESAPETGEQSMGEITIDGDTWEDVDHFRADTPEGREDILTEMLENESVDVSTTYISKDGDLVRGGGEAAYAGVDCSHPHGWCLVNFLTTHSDGSKTEINLAVDEDGVPASGTHRKETFLDSIFNQSEGEYEYSMDAEYYSEVDEKDRIRAKF